MKERRIIYVFDADWANWKAGFNRIEKGRPHRLPQAYADLLQFFCCDYKSLKDHVKDDDVIIFQTPPSDELRRLKIIKEFVGAYDVFITQESCIFDWFDWSAEEQALYIEILAKCNAFLYHNEHDKKIMSLYLDKFVYYSGCMNLAVPFPKTADHLNNPLYHVSIPSPVKRYQRGMISHKIAEDTLGGKERIVSMTYRRPKKEKKTFLSFPDSYKIGRATHVKGFLSVQGWFNFVNNSKFGIDIHRDISGGNVCLEYASMAVPLVGNIESDYQRTLFPSLSFEYHDYENIKKTILKLSQDGDFFTEVSKYALKKVEETYSSDKVTAKFKKELQKLI